MAEKEKPEDTSLIEEKFFKDETTPIEESDIIKSVENTSPQKALPPPLPPATSGVPPATSLDSVDINLEDLEEPLLQNMQTILPKTTPPEKIPSPTPHPITTQETQPPFIKNRLTPPEVPAATFEKTTLHQETPSFEEASLHLDHLLEDIFGTTPQSYTHIPPPEKESLTSVNTTLLELHNIYLKRIDLDSARTDLTGKILDLSEKILQQYKKYSEQRRALRKQVRKIEIQGEKTKQELLAALLHYSEEIKDKTSKELSQLKNAFSLLDHPTLSKEELQQTLEPLYQTLGTLVEKLNEQEKENKILRTNVRLLLEQKPKEQAPTYPNPQSYPKQPIEVASQYIPHQSSSKIKTLALTTLIASTLALGYSFLNENKTNPCTVDQKTGIINYLAPDPKKATCGIKKISYTPKGEIISALINTNKGPLEIQGDNPYLQNPTITSCLAKLQKICAEKK